MAGKKGQKKRVWLDEEKRSICAQARVSGVSVAQVARRYAMNTNLIHKWLRDPRFSSVDQALDLPEPDHATFLPIEVSGMTPVPTPTISRTEPPRLCRRVICSCFRRPYRVSSGLHRTPPLLLRAGCNRWGQEGGDCYTNRPISRFPIRPRASISMDRSG